MSITKYRIVQRTRNVKDVKSRKIIIQRWEKSFWRGTGWKDVVVEVPERVPAGWEHRQFDSFTEAEAYLFETYSMGNSVVINGNEYEVEQYEFGFPG